MPLAAVLIASSDLLPALEQRAAAGGDALRFSDAQPLEALEAITRHRPPLIVLERFFAATPRGAALINRIKADPGCAHAEIRVLSHTGDYSRVIQGAGAAGPAGSPGSVGSPGSLGSVQGSASSSGLAGSSGARAGGAATAAVAPATPTPGPAVTAAAASGGATAPAAAIAAAAPAAPALPSTQGVTPHLDWRGTRRYPRYRLRDGITAQVDGKDATLIDLSAGGAQVVSTATLRPNQKLRISLPLEPDARLRATVAWASFELPKGAAQGPRYRAGIEFEEQDPRIGPFAEKNSA